MQKKSPMELALDRVVAAREAHEALHGKPDDYNGVTIGSRGHKARLHAYTDEWNKTFDAWTDAFDALSATAGRC